MDSINLSINPSYYCNFRCNFCYLSTQSLSSTQKIHPDVLLQRLSEVSTYRHIDRVDLYGGEIGMLRPDYFSELKKTIKFFYQDEISLITNLSVVPEFMLDDDIDLSVSWDYKAREKSEVVYQNMLSLKKDFHILILASESVVSLSDLELNAFIQKLNALPSLKTVEVKPYSLNLYNHQQVGFPKFEEFIKRLLALSKNFKFEFINEVKIQKSLSFQNNAWSDDHLYITPSGSWAVLDFDEQKREYFLEVANFQEYLKWSEHEKTKVGQSKVCSQCKYFGHCLSEHLQYVENLTQGCNGFEGLLNWYEHGYLR